MAIWAIMGIVRFLSFTFIVPIACLHTLVCGLFACHHVVLLACMFSVLLLCFLRYCFYCSYGKRTQAAQMRLKTCDEREHLCVSARAA